MPHIILRDHMEFHFSDVFFVVYLNWRQYTRYFGWYQGLLAVAVLNCRRRFRRCFFQTGDSLEGRTGSSVFILSWTFRVPSEELLEAASCRGSLFFCEQLSLRRWPLWTFLLLARLESLDQSRECLSRQSLQSQRIEPRYPLASGQLTLPFSHVFYWRQYIHDLYTKSKTILSFNLEKILSATTQRNTHVNQCRRKTIGNM